MPAVRPGPSTVSGLCWLVRVGPASLGAWGIAMGWGRTAVYSHTQRLAAAGWLERCLRTRGEGNLVYASRAGVRFSGITAAAIEKRPAPYSWPHAEACAWTAAWLTARGRQLVGPREMLVQRRWRSQLRWRERGETRLRNHRPDLAGRLPDGRLVPIEVELTEKSAPRLRAVIELHASWVAEGKTPAVMYVCASDRVADRVRDDGERSGLSIERGTLRTELVSTLQREAVAACTSVTGIGWHLSGAEAT